MCSSHLRLALTIIAGLFIAAACSSAATASPVLTPTASSVPATSTPTIPRPTPQATEPAHLPPSPTPRPPTEPPPNPLASPLRDISAVSGTCALTNAGGVKCWGDHWIYLARDHSGRSVGTLLPVGMAGLRSGVSAVSGTCALTNAGGVKCWGSRWLANDTTTDSLVPVAVTGLTSGVTAISAGSQHACALTTMGGVKCWGLNSSGQLGDGTTISSNMPVDVIGLASGVSAISVGWDRACAVMNGGGVKCWGWVGDGTSMISRVPIDVPGLASGVSAISVGGNRACALTTSGGAKCWGASWLGDGTTNDSNVPVDVIGLASGVSAISAGWEHTCAVTSGGGVKCWGEGAGIGADLHGDGSTPDSPVPIDVTGLASGISAISAGQHHTCAVTSGGRVKCWGSNERGQLGTGTTSWASLVPVDVSGVEVDPLVGSVVVTVSDRLRVRSEPRVSNDSLLMEPVLPLGTEMVVLDGPVGASGYTWYKVVPVLSSVGLEWPFYGWVAMAGKDGEPWIGPAQ